MPFHLPELSGGEPSCHLTSLGFPQSSPAFLTNSLAAATTVEVGVDADKEAADASFFCFAALEQPERVPTKAIIKIQAIVFIES
ncbi:hypothetical protein [Prosthecobacter sp.]|uniref:hypothetical protein n=1 Tax=Prosthecobacter sp. TaxID=1965333 RepID=UPI00378379AE